MKMTKLLSVLMAVLLVLPLLPIGVLPAAAAETVSSTYSYNGTDYNLYTGFNATSGASGVTTAEDYDKLVDGSLSAKYCRTTTGAYVEFNATTDGFAPFGYVFTTGNDSSTSTGRNPKSWTIKAKAASSDDWTTLVDVSNNQVMQNVDLTDYAFTIDYSGDNIANLRKYKYFRVDFTEYQGGSVFQLEELRFFGFDEPIIAITARAATCTAVGYTTNCYFLDGTYYSDEACTQPLTASQVEIPMLAHTLVHQAAVAHTAENNGNIEYWQCSACGKYFSDANAATEITEFETIDWAPVSYIDENGEQAAYGGPVNVVTSLDTAWADGWYVVLEDTTVDNRVTVNGTVNLVLLNGATLSVPKGINVVYNASSPNTFNIFAQSTDENTMGALTIDSVESNNAAIGGDRYHAYGNISVYGGKLTLKSGNSGAAIGTGDTAYNNTSGTILIAGGIVNVPSTNGYGAGIGGGEYSCGGNIVITGGVIDVKGGAHSAGIGGCDGYNGGNITISGGKITARAGDRAAAIGGGDFWGSTPGRGGSAGTITITGGEITTYCNTNGTGIGDSYTPSTSGASSVTIALSQGSSINTQSVAAENVTFNGNHSIERNGVKHFADEVEAALGGLIILDMRAAYTVSFVDSDGTTVIEELGVFSGDAVPTARTEPIKSGYIFDKWTINGAAYDFSTPVTGNITLTASYTAAPALTYLDETGSEVTTSSYYTLGTKTDLSGLPAGIYTTPVNLTYEDRIVFAENAVLVLQNGTTLTANSGIEVKPGASLTIFAQSVSGDQTEGKLVANTKIRNRPGIGYTENPLEGDRIAIYGGNINARASYDYGAGIGGGHNVASVTVVIGGGTVTAVGGYDGAGIGGGYCGIGNVTITGGTVVANGGTYAAGIGGGYTNIANVTITGGSVTAESGSYGAAGIGCGYDRNGGSVTISGGQVTVKSHSNTYGIGGCSVGGPTAISLGAVDNSDFIVSPDYRGTVTFSHALRLRDAQELTVANADNIAGQYLISADIENITVTFVDEDGTTVLSSVSVVPGSTVTAPEAPDKMAQFKSFLGWFVNGSAADVTAPFYDSVTLTATYVTIPMPQGEGTVQSPYLIASESDWNYLADAVNTYGFTFEDTYFKLTESISVTTKIGSKDNNRPFSGTFDGNGKTITLDLAADGKQGSAPFSFVRGATIRDLITDGAVHASAYHASALVGFAEGVTIENCKVSASILFARNMTSVHSGSFIGHALSSPFSMTGCVFDGTIAYETEGSGSASGLTNVAGLVGWDDASTPTILNCLNAGTFLSNANRIAPIARVSGRGTITNCYTTVQSSCSGSNNDNRGDFARTISAGENVSLDLANKTTYTVSGVAASDTGVICNGNIFAANGETVVLEAAYTGSETGVDLQYTATAGTLKQNGSTLTLTVVGDATVNVKTGVFYNVTVQDGIELGTVTVSESVVESADIITITVAYEGMSDLSSLTVMNGTTPVELTKTGATTWTFVMPEHDVTVNAVFVVALTNGSGTANDPYEIANVHDWNVFARLVNAGNTGLCAKQTADISGVTTMIGTNANRYSGTYDGNGHTLTVALTATGEACGPFSYTNSAKIVRLFTAGTITTAYKFAGGIIGHSFGNTEIYSCVSSVSIESSISGDGTHGGLVGIMDSSLTIVNCLFNGRIGSSSTSHCGGIVGWKNNGNTLDIRNTLAAPEEITLSLTNCATIARNGGTFTNCWYKTQIGEAQGTAVGDMTEAELVSALGAGWTLKNGTAWPSTDEMSLTTAIVTTSDLIYTGEVLTPAIVVKSMVGVELTEGTDYTMTVSPATVQSVGTYTVTVTGKGSYSGVNTATFDVTLHDPQLQEDGSDLYVNMIANNTITIDLRNETHGFTLKVYDDGGKNSNYSNSQNSYVIVIAPEGYVLQIDGTIRCETNFDYVHVYDSDMTTILLEKFTGSSTTSNPVTSTGNSAKIYFRTDSSSNNSGFTMNVKVIDPNRVKRFDFIYKENTKALYPNTGSMFTLPDCTDIFTLDPAEDFNGWDANGTVYQPGDTITVANDMTFTALISKKPVLIDDGEGGFYAKIIGSVQTLDLTGRPSGFTFKVYDSGGANGDYSNSEEGSLIITIPAGFVLKVSGSGSAENGYDYLLINDADGNALGSNYTLSGGKKCYTGSFTVEELTSEGSMTIAFHSDSSSTSRGFELTLSLEKPSDACDLNEDGQISISDVTVLLDVLSGILTISKDCDVNGDTTVDIRDVTALLDTLQNQT